MIEMHGLWKFKTWGDTRTFGDTGFVEIQDSLFSIRETPELPLFLTAQNPFADTTLPGPRCYHAPGPPFPDAQTSRDRDGPDDQP
jgi:hypothetical protein